MLEWFAQLAYKSLFNHSHNIGFVVINFNLSMRLCSGVGIRRDSSLVFHARHRHLASFVRNFLNLIHNLDALYKSVDSSAGILNFF